MKENQIYLGKSGKIFGPYSRDEYDQMMGAGKLVNYNWIWDWKAKTWKPIDLPPPPPEGMASSTGSEVDWSSLEGLLYDRFAILSGKVQNVTESGCAFLAEDETPGPRFSLKSHAQINLYHQNKKKCTQAKISIMGVTHANKVWIYQLRWDQSPS